MNSADNEIIIKSKKNTVEFENFQKKTPRVVIISIIIGFLGLLPFFLGLIDEISFLGMILMFLIGFAFMWAIAYPLHYFSEKWQFENIHWAITSKGITITITNSKGGASEFVATDHISSVAAANDNSSLAVAIDNAEQPLVLKYLANAREMESVLKDLIYKTDKQKDVRIEETVNDSKETDTDSKETVTDNIDEIIKYKKLLDLGIITQEEFDAKKKQLLNL